jgi:hypothetical protein
MADSVSPCIPLAAFAMSSSLKSGRRRVGGFPIWTLFLIGAIAGSPARAQNATTTVTVGSGPVAVAVNPTTNTIYVANNLDDSVTVIDGITNPTVPG